jgi:hypothetical protein
MELVTVKYSGSRGYRDRTAYANDWQPGDVKAIPKDAAQQLRRFAEFEVVKAKPTKEQEAEAVLSQKAAAKKQEDEHNETEGMLLAVQSWDKNQLEAYARKYDTELDKRRSVSSLRLDVANLVERFGVR